MSAGHASRKLVCARAAAACEGLSPPVTGLTFAAATAAAAAAAVEQWLNVCRSKLAGIWFAYELQRRHPDLIVLVLHPGVVQTNLFHESRYCRLQKGSAWVSSQSAQHIKSMAGTVRFE